MKFNLTERHLENKVDQRLIDLYELLTHSTFDGRYDTTEVVRRLYALLCIDLANAGKQRFTDAEYALLSKELVRINDTKAYGLEYPMENLAKGMLIYLKDHTIKDIKSGDSYELKRTFVDLTEGQ